MPFCLLSPNWCSVKAVSEMAFEPGRNHHPPPQCRMFPVTTHVKRQVKLLQGVCSLPLSPPVEVPVFVLRVLSELSLLLLGQESAGAEESHGANAKDRKREQEERSQIINVFKSTLFPRYVWL